MKKLQIITDVSKLKEWESSDPSQGTHKWVAVGISTGLPSIVGAKWDNVPLTLKDEEEALAMGLPKGSILYWAKADELVNTPRVVNISRGNSSLDLEISCIDEPTNTVSWGRDNYYIDESGGLVFGNITADTNPSAVIFDYKDKAETGTVSFTNLPESIVLLLEHTADGKYSGLLLKDKTKGYNRSGMNTTYNLTVVRGSGDGCTLQDRKWDNHRSEWSSNTNDYGPYRPLATSAQTSVAKDWTNGKLSVKYIGNAVYEILFNDELWFTYDMKQGSSLVGSGRARAEDIIYKVGLMYGYSGSHKSGVITNVTFS